MGKPMSHLVQKIFLDSHLNGKSTKKIINNKSGLVALEKINKSFQKYREDGKIKPGVS